MTSLGDFYRHGRIGVFFVLLFPLLSVLSFVYGIVLRLRVFLYDRRILPSLRPQNRLISIGNITLGGSGKTPLTEYVAGRLSSKVPVCILLRGYKRPGHRQTGSDYPFLGDEGSLLKENLADKDVRVKAGADRAGQVLRMEKEGFRGIFLLDDGFQHWRLKRDLDIVTCDACAPFGNGRLLPAGQLREPKSHLKRADVFCLTRCDQADPQAVRDLEETLKAIQPSALIIKAIHEPQYLYDLKIRTRFSLDVLKAFPAGMICGIARPEAFEKTLRGLGAEIRWKKCFEDHHAYTPDEIRAFCRQAAKKNIRVLITTQKDGQRLAGYTRHMDLGLDILVLKIAIKVIRGQEELDARLRSVCGF